MQLDPETIQEIRDIIGRDFIVEVTVTFYDNSEEATESVDIGATAEFDKGTPTAEIRGEMSAMLDSLKDLVGTIATD